jgi:hypothetical protein
MPFERLPAEIRAQWPFAPRYKSVNGSRMDEGGGDPVLLLHGNPTWGFLTQDIVPPLVRSGYRAETPDDNS